MTKSEQKDRAPEVRVWSAVADAELARRWSWVLPDPIAAMLQHRSRIARERRVVQLALRRTVVAASADVAVRDVRLEVDDIGHAHCPGTRLELSAAHHDDATFLAVSDEVAVGIDVEPASESDWDSAVGAVLTPRERDALMSLPKERREESYFACWTLKEAVMKVLGEGLSDRDPSTIEVAFSPGSPRLLAIDGCAPREPWALVTTPESGRIISVAVPAVTRVKIERYRWPIDLPPIQR